MPAIVFDVCHRTILGDAELQVRVENFRCSLGLKLQEQGLTRLWLIIMGFSRVSILL